MLRTADLAVACGFVAALAAPPSLPQPAASADAARASTVRRLNAGVRKIEILPGNVGYLDLTNFFRPDEACEAIAAAMHMLSRADALVLDMRANGGGSPGTVAFLISYLLDGTHVPLYEIVHRAPEPSDRYTTEPTPAADRNAGRPLFVLTSSRTFAAAEGVAYLLPERHRAEVVGEVAAGAANPGRPYPLNDRFSVNVPNGRVKSAIGGGNWEGSGVTPDVATNAADALPTAHARALRLLIERRAGGCVAGFAGARAEEHGGLTVAVIRRVRLEDAAGTTQLSCVAGSAVPVRLSVSGRAAGAIGIGRPGARRWREVR